MHIEWFRVLYSRHTWVGYIANIASESIEENNAFELTSYPDRVPSLSNYLRDYCSAAGRPWPVDQWMFYIAFSVFRGASIYAGVHCRWIMESNMPDALGKRLIPSLELHGHLSKENLFSLSTLQLVLLRYGNEVKTDLAAPKHKQQSMIFVDTTVLGRLGPGMLRHCMRLIGAADRGMQMMVQRALQRKAFGKLIAQHGSILSDVTRCRIDLEKTRLLVLGAADQLDRLGNKNARGTIAMAKVAAPNMSLKVLVTAMQVQGGAGLSGDTVLAISGLQLGR
ncbi:hypothetical protein RND71_001928 [Anisodus tanguticus]|uniref:Acyl-CoA dehydrogenase/oxidase C-terminal domain-containing protein n=1 Tax=Anisodus tanguticus TaxID=243964 RepID=A0AAE1VW72_9SOLA|nr:hypothetical protein RND71_001928 [Anisodus tanguticus]